MGRAPCCSKIGLQRGPWTQTEDEALIQYIKCHGEGNWRHLPKNAGILRCGKSCRLRWMNYLRPDIKRGNIGPEEEDLIIRLHALLGNKWSLIAGRIPGRTDNDIKNYWNSHLSKKLKSQGHVIREGSSSKPKSRRSQSTQKDGGTKNMQDKSKEAVGTAGVTQTITVRRTEIQAPKPTRILPIARTSNTMETSEGSDCYYKIGTTTSEDRRDSSVDNLEKDWSSVEEGSPFVDLRGPNHSQVCDSLLEDNLFQSLFQEYSQLLNSEDGQLHMFPSSLSSYDEI